VRGRTDRLERARSRRLEGWKPAGEEPFCKPLCKPDASGRCETGEMQKNRDNLTPPIRTGQRDDQRLPETAETYVVVLITQRSEVQILPPLPGETVLRTLSGGPFSWIV
jgi:hypothetical protein